MNHKSYKTLYSVSCSDVRQEISIPL